MDGRQSTGRAARAAITLEVGVRLRPRERAPRRSHRAPDPGGRYRDPAIAESRTILELLIDAEEDKYLRAVLVGMLREGGLSRPEK